MSFSIITTRFSRTVSNQCRSSRLLFGRQDRNLVTTVTHQLTLSRLPNNKVVTCQVPLLNHSALNSSACQRFFFSSSASQQTNEKETAQSGNEQEEKANNEKSETTINSTNQTEASVSDENTDSDSEIDLSRDDLVKLVVEKENFLQTKQEEFERMKDKVLRTYAEMENVKERTRRESENVKKFAIQNFAKSLLDVADNLSRASSAAKESFTNVDTSKDTASAIQQLKILLEGVEMTEKQLAEVFKKFELVKYDPVNEEFDPNRHNAVFQVPDSSKPANHVAVVLKSGYMLHDRVIRPAEVGVTVALSNEEES